MMYAVEMDSDAIRDIRVHTNFYNGWFRHSKVDREDCTDT
jgi:hypothetical protein